MARSPRLRANVFLDTTYAIALVNPSDQLHARAVALADELTAAGTRLVTTQAVLLEIGNALSDHRIRAKAVELLLALEADPQVDVVPLSESLYARAFQLFQSRPDKNWGLIDCLSFVVMADRGITEALTFDKDFEQAGFRALLRDP